MPEFPSEFPIHWNFPLESMSETLIHQKLQYIRNVEIPFGIGKFFFSLEIVIGDNFRYSDRVQFPLEILVHQKFWNFQNSNTLEFLICHIFSWKKTVMCKNLMCKKYQYVRILVIPMHVKFQDTAMPVCWKFQ